MADSIVTEVATLADVLLRSADSFPEREALVLPAQRATYEALRNGACRVARSLVGMGVQPGDHVGILIPNCVEYAETLLGIALCGAVAVPLNVRLRSTELGFIIRDAALVALVSSSHPDDPTDFKGQVYAALADAPAPHLRQVVLIRGEGGERVLGAEQFAAYATGISQAQIEQLRQRVRVRDPALIIYTSGTTAHPKGCILSHEAITRGPVERARYRLKAATKDVVWGGGPMFHIGTLAPFIGSLGTAGTFLTDTYFDPGRALDLMKREGVTLAWPWFSAVVQGLIGHTSFDARALSSLRYLFMIAPPTLVAEVQRLFPDAEILQACGMTETAGIFALSDVGESAAFRATTQGKAARGVEVRIVDPESGRDVADGTLGEIWVRGYNVMEGYWGAPEKTAETLTVDRWLKTGDLYTRLPDGSLIFGGRYKDMLKVGGENVAAVEVEAFLCTHPAVKTAEVVGRVDSRLDEVPVAFVELHAGHAASETMLIDHCRGRLASYKVPRAVFFVQPSDWPMSATKVDKRALRDRVRTLSGSS